MLASLRFFAALVVLSGAAAWGQSDPAAGYILKCAGAWTASLNGKERPLKAGAVVNPGDKLHSNPPDALLGLVLYDGTYLKCPNADKCKQPLEIPARPAPQGTLSAFLDRLQNKHLPPVAFVTSRAAGAPVPPVELRDAIVTPAGSRLDLTPALSDAPPLELHFYLEPLDAPAGCEAMLFKLAASARTVEVSDFHARCNGLYQLSATDDSMLAAYPATILFVAPADAARAARTLDEAASATARWQLAGEDEKRTFRRLTLGAIQQTLQSAK